jgi:succinyl-diaminopimelate desuccinylase
MVALIEALQSEPLDKGTAHFDPSHLEFTSIDVGNKTVNVIPSEARARFNIRFNDVHTQETLRALVEQRAKKAAGDKFRWSIAWEPSNADAFLTAPGAFVENVISAVAEVTGKKPELSTTGGTSDARFIKNYCPVIEFGLINATMHKIDECVATDDLVGLTAIYRKIIERYFN